MRIDEVAAGEGYTAKSCTVHGGKSTGYKFRRGTGDTTAIGHVTPMRGENETVGATTEIGCPRERETRNSGKAQKKQNGLTWRKKI